MNIKIKKVKFFKKKLTPFNDAYLKEGANLYIRMHILIERNISQN